MGIIRTGYSGYCTPHVRPPYQICSDQCLLFRFRYARIRKLGVRHLEFDDYLILVAAIFYTLLIVTLNLTAQGGGSALAMPGEDVSALTDKEVKVREKGAKIDLVAEQAMLNTIWILKVCTLKLYGRLT